MIVGDQQNLQRVGFDNFFECSSNGKLGSLALAWKQGVELDISFVSNHIMNILCFQTLVINQGDFNFQYELEAVGNSFTGPWLYLGDFNALISQSDKMGG